MCRAIHQRGGVSVVRTAGYHDRTGIQQCLDAGVDILLIPYVQVCAYMHGIHARHTCA